MKINLTVPENLSEITLEQYQKFAKFNIEENQNTNFLLHKMVEIFCNINLKDIAKIKFTDVQKIISDINSIFEEKPKLVTKFNLNGIKYGFIPKLDDITLGEYIDLDNTLSNWDSMHKAMCILYRPITLEKDDRYRIEEYVGLDNANMFKQLSLNVVMSALVFFWNLKEELLATTLNYLETETNNNLTLQAKETLTRSGVGINPFTGLLRAILPNSTK